MDSGKRSHKTWVFSQVRCVVSFRASRAAPHTRPRVFSRRSFLVSAVGVFARTPRPPATTLGARLTFTWPLARVQERNDVRLARGLGGGVRRAPGAARARAVRRRQRLVVQDDDVDARRDGRFHRGPAVRVQSRPARGRPFPCRRGVRARGDAREAHRRHRRHELADEADARADGGGRGPEHAHVGLAGHEHRRQRLRRGRRQDAGRRPGETQGCRRRRAASVLRPRAHRAVLVQAPGGDCAARRAAPRHRGRVHLRRRQRHRAEEDGGEQREARDSTQGHRHELGARVHQAGSGAEHPARYLISRRDDRAAEAVRQGSLVRQQGGVRLPGGGAGVQVAGRVHRARPRPRRGGEPRAGVQGHLEVHRRDRRGQGAAPGGAGDGVHRPVPHPQAGPRAARGAAN